MPTPPTNSHWPTKVATLALPTREVNVLASVWPTSGGTLILLGELNLAPTPRAELTAAITTTLERSLNEVAAQTEAEATLEKIALQLNNDLKPRERLFGNPLAPRYHFCLALLRGNLLVMTNIGHLQAWVVAADHLTDIFNSGTQKRTGGQALFQHIVSGQLEPGETLVLTSPNLNDFFTPDKVRQLFTVHSPGLALREAELTINNLPHHPPLGIIALKLNELPSEVSGFQPSLQHFLQTKDTTNSLLKPKLWDYLKRHWGLKRKSKPTPAVNLSTEVKPSEHVLAKPVSVHSDANNQPEHQNDSLGSKLIKTASQLTWLTSRQGVKDTLSNWLSNKLINWRRLPYTKRVLLVLAGLVIMAFSQSIVSLGKNQLKHQDSERYNKLVSSLTEQQAAIEAAIIYHDDTKAQGLLGQALEMLGQLPQNTASRQQQQQNLALNLETLERRLKRLAEATNIQTWVELPKQETWRQLSLNGNMLYLLSASGKIIPVTADGKIGSTLNLPANLKEPQALTPLNQKSFLAWGSDGSAVIDIGSRQTNSTLKIDSLLDAVIYENRLYYLSRQPINIYRTTQQGLDFAKASKWLRPSQGDLSQARSLAVDGAIYVASATQVQKYVLGLKRNFDLQPVEPPLQNVTSLKTSGEGDYLYLTEPTAKRLVIYDKQGKLVLQLGFPELSELSSLTYDPVNKYLYVLSTNKIYRLKLTDYLF